MSWYSIVSSDISRIYDSIDFFQTELISARNECKLSGSLEKASASLPGIVEQRYSQLQEVDAILELLNIELTKMRSNTFRKYLEHYPRALSSRDCEKYVDGEDEIVEMMKIINEFALLRNQWLGITKALDSKSWQVNNIVKLRCAGLDDASI
jgi:hypothetical protein